MRFIKILLSLSIFSTALIGDFIVFRSKYSNSLIFRALSDSLVHGSIGLISSLLFFTHEISISSYASVCNVIFCTFLSSFIDVDHAIAAKSVFLKDMMNLKQRGIFHCTTLWLLVTTILFIYSYLSRKISIFVLSFMILIAFSSHHIRDANRRGLWFYPIGSTPPISKFLYVILLSALPNLYGMVYKCTEARLYRYSVVEVDYKMIV